MFSKDILIFDFSPQKIIFSFFSQISKNPPDSGDGDVGGDGEKFFIGKCYENLVVNSPKKNLGTIPNVKFFTADPYFGVVFSTGLRKSAQNRTFLSF